MNKLPRIGLGTMGYGGYFEKDDLNIANYRTLLELAYDHGARIIDTAEVYAEGRAEEIIGSLNKSVKDQLFIMSKFSPENSEPKLIEKSIHRSLKRLNRDYVDVYQPHWPNP